MRRYSGAVKGDVRRRMGRLHRQHLVVDAIAAPPLWEGPLLALQRLVQCYLTHRLLAVIPADSAMALDLAQGVAQGQRRLQPLVVRNINDPAGLSTAGQLPASAPGLSQS